MNRIKNKISKILLTALAAWGCQLRDGGSAAASSAEIDTIYIQKLSKPATPMRVFHLGHSLVGRDMPAMLAQLAAEYAHSYESQLGWGTSLREHWEPDLKINGFSEENAHPRFRDAREAVSSGDYDALVLTEMVEIKDAIRYHNSAEYLAKWAESAWASNNLARVYLYETWHSTDDADGWANRIDMDLRRYWEGEILYHAVDKTARAIYVIPAGQVLARFARAAEERGGSENLFSDNIHLNDMGAYLVALTHYAALYHRSPVGLPYRLKRADGSDANAPSAETARLMQEIVWEVVSSYPKSGVAENDS